MDYKERNRTIYISGKYQKPHSLDFFPSVMNKKLTITSSSGNKLAGILHKASSGSTLYILCHGYGGSKDDFYSRQIATGLQKKKIDAFRFDYSGAGESTGSPMFDMKKQIQDTESVIAFFASKYRIIVLIGGSMGGLISTLTCMQNKTVKKLILINPFLYLNEGVNLSHRVKLISARIAALFNPQIRAIFKLYLRSFKPEKLKLPVYILSSKNDEVVNHKHSLRFFNELTCNKTLQWYNDMDHAVTKQKYINRVVSYIVKWIT